MIIQHVTPKLDLSGSVAIVGSSAKLRDVKHGKTIDGFDHVLRFNRAPTEGHEEYAGSKTTLRIVNGHVFMNMPFTRWEEDQTFVKRLRNTKLILAKDPHLAGRRGEAIDESIELYTITGMLDSKYKGIKQKKSQVPLPEVGPTVGLMGIMLMVNSGIKPVIFGWSTSVEEPMSHYYNNRSSTTSKYHRWELELSLINEFIQKDKVEIHR